MFSADEAAFLGAWAACSHSTHSVTTDAREADASATEPTKRSQGSAWASDEHERFLEAMHLYPTGPWKAIAAHIRTRTPRQARTHAQKHKEKLHRRQRKLQRMKSYLVVDKSMSPTVAPTTKTSTSRHGLPWTPAEQDRLREAHELYPHGPWRLITDHVGTRTIRQVMSYSQKQKRELQKSETESIRAATATDASHNSATSTTPDDNGTTVDLSLLDTLLAEELLEETPQDTQTTDLIHQLLFGDEELPNISDGLTTFTPY